MSTNKPIPAGRVMLTNVRLSFPGLFNAEAFKPGDDPKFKATFLIPKDDPQVKVIEAKILAALKEKYPAKADALLRQIRGNPNKCCYQDGDTKAYDGYEGMMAVSAKSSARPLVLDADRTPLVEADGKPYAGCYVNASIDFFAYDSSGVGVSASLRGVQFVSDGDSFAGGRPAAADEFQDVTAGAEDFA
jgi:hypothetical protein